MTEEEKIGLEWLEGNKPELEKLRKQVEKLESDTEMSKLLLSESRFFENAILVLNLFTHSLYSLTAICLLIIVYISNLCYVVKRKNSSVGELISDDKFRFSSFLYVGFFVFSVMGLLKYLGMIQ